MKRIATLSLAIASTMAAFPASAEEVSGWRIFVADHATGAVQALDLDAPENRWRFDVEGPAKLYPTPSGRGVIAVQSDNDRVDFFKSGIDRHSHGDHADMTITEPEAIEGGLEGPRPFHVVNHDGVTSINFDRGGYAALIEEAALLKGEFDGETFRQAHAHHGFAVPMGDRIVSSVASDEAVEEGELPPRVGLQVFEQDGTAVGELQTCTNLHGEAFSGSYLLAGCDEGAAFVTQTSDGFELGMLPYPTDFPDGKTGTLAGARAMQAFLGDYGDNALVVIDPAEEPHFKRIDFDFRHVDFVLDPAHPQAGYVLTEDGTLHRLDLLDGAVDDSAKVTEPYSMDGHWRDPRPRLAIAGEDIVLTDPREGLLRVVDAESLEETATIDVEGTPYNLIAIGGSGIDH